MWIFLEVNAFEFSCGKLATIFRSKCQNPCVYKWKGDNNRAARVAVVVDFDCEQKIPPVPKHTAHYTLLLDNQFLLTWHIYIWISAHFSLRTMRKAFSLFHSQFPFNININSPVFGNRNQPAFGIFIHFHSFCFTAWESRSIWNKSQVGSANFRGILCCKCANMSDMGDLMGNDLCLLLCFS